MADASLAPITRLTLSRDAKPSTDWGNRPELKWLPLEQLGIDFSYQRDILENGRATIRRIVEEFRWSRFGQLVVAVRGDRYAVIDGQHRAAAAFLLGIEKVPCMVISCPLEEEAEAFAAINGNVTRPSALQIFSAKLVAGDRKSRALRAVCSDVGVTIPRYAIICDKLGMCTAISSLESCFRVFGRDTLGLALQLILSAGDASIGLLKPSVIGGMCDFLKAQPSLAKRPAVMTAAIAEASLAKLYARAKRIQGVDGGTVRSHFAEALHTACKRAIVAA